MENAIWTALGWLIGFLTPGTLWDLPFIRRIRMRRHQRRVEAMLASASGRIVVGGFAVKDIAAVNIFEPPLTRIEVECTFSLSARPLPPELSELTQSYLPNRVKELKGAGRTVDLNERYSLQGLRIERPQIDGRRRNRPSLAFEPSNFSHYLMLNDALDKPILQGVAGMETIRQRYLAPLGAFEWRQLGSIPVYPLFATVTVVVTKDGMLVVSVRSSMQAIGSDESYPRNEWKAAMACAEGMLRPVDSLAKPPNEEPNPFVTATRALADELGLHVGTHFSEAQLFMLGIGFDTERYQPVAVFVLQLAEHEFADVYRSWQLSKDCHENLELLAVPVSSQDLANLLRRGTPWKGRPARLFSNQQQLGALLAAFHLLGPKAMSDALLQTDKHGELGR